MLETGAKLTFLEELGWSSNIYGDKGMVNTLSEDPASVLKQDLDLNIICLRAYNQERR